MAYSTLAGALDINKHGKLERTISIVNKVNSPILTKYDPLLHYSRYSALSGALG